MRVNSGEINNSAFENAHEIALKAENKCNAYQKVKKHRYL